MDEFLRSQFSAFSKVTAELDVQSEIFLKVLFTLILFRFFMPYGFAEDFEFRFVPNEPTFSVITPQGESLGIAEFYRMSTAHGVTDQDRDVFVAVPGRRKPMGGFAEFLALKVRVDTWPIITSGTVKKIYVGFRSKKDPSVQKLYRLFDAVTMLQLDRKVAAVELDLSLNLTRRKKDENFNEEFYLIEPKQLKVKLANGMLVDVEPIIQADFAVDPAVYLNSLVNKDLEICAGEFKN